MSNEPNSPSANASAPNVHNGTYTVDSPRGHFTVEISTAGPRSKLAGKRIISMLVGPNNETDFRGVAFWSDAQRAAIVWKAHRGPGSDGWITRQRWKPAPPANDNPFDTTKADLDPHRASESCFSTVEQKIAILLDLVERGDAGFWHAEGYSVLLAGTCVKCNNKLTAPESIRTGIGPTCGNRR